MSTARGIREAQIDAAQQMVEMRHAFAEGMRNLQKAMKEGFGHLKTALGDGMHFSSRVGKASYNVLGQYSQYPVDSETLGQIFETRGGKIGLVALALPVMLPCIVASLFSHSFIPLFLDGARSFGASVRLMANFPRLDLSSENRLEQFSAHYRQRKAGSIAYGSLGAGLGFVVGLIPLSVVFISRVFSNTVKALLQSAFWFVREVGREEERKPDRLADETYLRDISEVGQSKKHLAWRFGGGVVGVVLGSIIGATIAAVVAAFRALSNSIKACGQTWMFFARFALGEKNKDVFQANDIFQLKDKSTRYKVWRYVAGFPGWLLGGVVGLLSVPVIASGRLSKRIIKNSPQSFKQVFSFIINLFVAKDHELKRLEKDERKLSYKIAGGPAAFVGGLMGVISVPFILSARFISNTVKAFGQSCLFFVRFALGKKREQTTQTKDISQLDSGRRYHAWRFGAGFIGLILGSVVGGFTALAIGAYRVARAIVKNSGISFKEIYATIINLFVAKDYELNHLENDERKLSYKIAGAPAAFVGGLAAFISAPFILAARVITNTLKACGQTCLFFVRFAFGKKREQTTDSKDISQLDSSKRYNAWRFGGGFIGLMLGGLVGGFAALAIGIARFAKAFFIGGMYSFARHFVFMAALARLDISKTDHVGLIKLQFKIMDAKKLALGAVGGALGVIVGIIPLTLVAIGRVFTNTMKAAFQTTLWFARESLPIYERKASGIEDPMHANDIGEVSKVKTINKGWRFGGGAIGLVAGAVFGAAVAIVIGAIRALSHSIKALGQTWMFFARFALGKKHKDAIEGNDIFHLQGGKRYKAWRYVGGFPGWLLGGVFGLISVPVIWFGRFVRNIFNRNNAYSFKQIYARIINVFVPKEDELKRDEKDQRELSEQLKGLPGSVAGSIAGVFSVPFILGARVVSNIIKAFGQSCLFFVRFALGKKREQTTQIKDISQLESGKRYRAWRFGAGFIGVILGSIVGCVSAFTIGAYRVTRAIVKNSGISFKQIYATIINVFVAKDYELTRLEKDERKLSYKIAGGPAAFVGGLMGIISIPFILSARYISNTVKAFGQSCLFFVRFALGKKREQTTQIKDISQLESGKRDKAWLFGVGFIGLILGSVAGGLSALTIGAYRVTRAIVKNSAVSFKQIYATIINVFVTKDYELTRLENDERKRRYKIAGGPATFVGGLAGIISVPFILGARFISNTVKAFGQSCLFFVRFALGKKREQTTQTKDISQLENGKRYKAWRVGGGFVGVILGSIVGGFTALAIAAYRVTRAIVKNSAVSFKEIYATIINLFVAKDRELKRLEKDERKLSYKIAGGPAAFVGGLMGVISIPFILAARFISNTVKAFGQSCLFFVRFALGKKREQTTQTKDISQLENGKRYKAWRVGGGFVGVILGSIVGGFTALAIGAYRVTRAIVKNSAISFKQIYTKIINIFVAKDYELTRLEKDERKLSYKIAGGPATLVGGLAGIISVPFILGARFISNTVKAFGQSCLFFVRFALGKKREQTTQTKDISQLENGKRYKAWRVGGGFVGVILGSIVGGFTALAIGAYRVTRAIVKNSAVSFKQIYAKIINPFVAKDYELTRLENDERKRRYKIAGAPATLVGGLMGVISIPFIFAARVVTNIVKACGQTCLFFVRFALGKKHKQTTQTKDISQLESGKRYKAWRFGGGLLGLLVGGVAGLISAGVILIARGVFTAFKRIINNTKQSFTTLSGSLMNGALGRERYAGWNADERSASQKGWGFLGYAASALLVGGIVLPSIMIVRKGIPVLGSIALVLFTPVTFIIKTISLLFKACGVGCRFTKDERQSTDETLQRIKNLFSSLTPASRLSDVIKDNGTGRETAGQFFIKTLTCNIKSSSTERLLLLVLKKYRENNHHITRELIMEAKEALKTRYQEDGWLDQAGTMEDKRNELDAVAETVSNYICDNHYALTEKKPAKISSFSHRFFGTPVIDSGSTTESMELDSSSSSYSAGY